MKKFIKNFSFLLICLFFVFFYKKVHGQVTYDQLRKHYENINESNEKALPYVNLYLKKAKKENNHTELVQGYRDEAYYSSDKTIKIKYIDSAIVCAKKTDDNHLLSTVYLLKGSLYNFYFKNYNLALTEYLTAYNYSKKDDDDYLKYKIVYQMGLVKNYLGYYSEAQNHFKHCIDYFEPRTKEKNHPNQIFNDSKGYLNSLHQSITCYQNQGNYQKGDSLIKTGLGFINQSLEFSLENAYFIKSKGISDYYHKNYKSAIRNLNEALPILKRNDDVYWISVSEFYIGKSNLDIDNEDIALKQFQKVDSIFKKRQFIFPELQKNYELLISYYQKHRNSQKELIYTRDLLNVDSILRKDFPYLSSKIHIGYDGQILIDAKNKSENQNTWSLGIIIILIAFVILLSFGIWRYYHNEKSIKQKYAELEKNLLQQNTKPVSVSYENISIQSKSVLSEDVFTDLQIKLRDFEVNEGFKENGLTIEHLAETFKTNKSYLSQYINDTKGVNFSKYLSTLRINFISHLMYTEPKYLRLKVQGLADECGISSRQNFSDLFQEINGIRPTDFIKQRKKELEEGNISGVISSPEA